MIRKRENKFKEWLRFIVWLIVWWYGLESWIIIVMKYWKKFVGLLFRGEVGFIFFVMFCFESFNLNNLKWVYFIFL